VKEDALLMINKKVSFEEEKEWLKNKFKSIKAKKIIYFLAEYNNKIIGSCEIELRIGRHNHVGEFSIAIASGYRRVGLGTFLGQKVVEEAKKRLKIKIARLSVYSENKPAQALYKKLGFKKVAMIPKQVQYKGRLIDEIIMLKYL
jgi:putative acetyltransferase